MIPDAIYTMELLPNLNMKPLDAQQSLVIMNLVRPGLDHSSVSIKVSSLFTGIRLIQEIPDLLLTTFLGNLKFRFGQWSGDFVLARDLKTIRLEP